jgi:hypothetical protein
VIARRFLFLIAAFITGAIGFWLRFHAPISPDMRDATGGAAYVVFWIFVAASLAPRTRPVRLALVILSITCVLEFLQLWHPFWLERTRATFLGRVILGTTFGWTDFPPYFVGALFGWAILRVASSPRATN